MIVTGRAVITGEAAAPVVADGAVLVRDGLVAAVGRAGELRAAHPAEPVTDTGLVVLPGLVNAHTHAYRAYARGMPVHLPTRDFEEILEHLKPLVAKWWLPDAVEFIDEVPKTSVGKFSKKDLRDRFKDYELPA